MKFLEEKITKFEQKHEEEPLVALRKSLSEQQVRPSSKEVEDGGRDQGMAHLPVPRHPSPSMPRHACARASSQSIDMHPRQSGRSDGPRILTDAQWPGAVLQRIEACQKGIEVCQKGIQKCLVKIQLAEANVSKALTNFNKALDYRSHSGKPSGEW
eukprot:g17990.t1